MNVWTVFIGCLIGLFGSIALLFCFVKLQYWFARKYGEQAETIAGTVVAIFAASALIAAFVTSQFK